jgi:hypothetical protein
MGMGEPAAEWQEELSPGHSSNPILQAHGLILAAFLRRVALRRWGQHPWTAGTGHTRSSEIAFAALIRRVLAAS